MRCALAWGVVIPLLLCRDAHAESVDDLLKQGRTALAKGQRREALTLASQAVLREPKNAQAHLLRGAIHAALQQHQEAVADFDKTIDLDPKLAEAYQRRGGEHFKLGHIEQSIEDFDKFLELKPDQTPGHWQRGISYYYAGRFDEGRKQFEGYEKVDTNDVENAVWHFLCVARMSGVERAQASLLKIGKDKRVPMMQVYELFAGRLKPEEVLTAAGAGQPPPAELNQRLFYAHLYLGLYYEATGDRRQALEHITKAAQEHKMVGHYMWDVARVHRDLLLNADRRNP